MREELSRSVGRNSFLSRFFIGIKKVGMESPTRICDALRGTWQSNLEGHAQNNIQLETNIEFCI